MSEIRRAVVKSYDAGAHKADVQIAGSLAVWLDAVRVATNIPPADVVAGRQCTILFLDPSNQDDAVIIAIQGAAPSVGEILVATATSSLTLTTTAQSITGDGDSGKVRLLLPTPGDWLIEVACDFDVTAADPNACVGDLFVNDSGTAEAGSAIYWPGSTANLTGRATVAQRWKVTTTADDTPVELKARKTAAAGTAIARGTHTRLTATGVNRSAASAVAASGTVVPETSFGQAATAGAATPYSRGDHTHGTPTDPVTAHAAIADVHHTKYLDSEAIAAVEAEATLALAGAVTVASTLAVTGLLTLSAALRVHNDGIEDRFGNQRIDFSSGFPFSQRVIIKGAVSGITLAVQDGDLDIEAGDLSIQELNVTRETFTGGKGIRVQPSAVNQNVALQAVPSGTGSIATFDMFNDSAATDADRVRFGAGPGGLGIELATGMQLDFAIAGETQMLHLTDTEGFMKGPLLIGTNADPVASAVLELRSTTGALLLPRMDETQRDALTAVNGMIIYNTTDNVVEAYENGTWVNV